MAYDNGFNVREHLFKYIRVKEDLTLIIPMFGGGYVITVAYVR